VILTQQYQRGDMERYRARLRKHSLKANFGMTPEDYDRILVAQNHVCAICHKPETKFDSRQGVVRRLSVDHDHATGRVRGLLCHHCNNGIGHLREDPKLLRAAIAYLKGR
jgi:hypothetical protein